MNEQRDATSGGASPWKTALRLGRISNVPTVWTNVAAGMALAGAAIEPALFVPLAIAMSCLYLGGMYLNDAFDWRWDTENRAERPIPQGLVSARTVFVAGFALMSAGLLGVALLWFAGGLPSPAPVAAAVALAALIVFYDVHHKKNPFSPVVMGLCRVGVYVVAGLCAASPARTLWIGCGLLLCHLIGLSYVAKQETKVRLATRWPVAFIVCVWVAVVWIATSGLVSGVRGALGAVPALLFAAVVGGIVVGLLRPSARPPGVWVAPLIAALALLDGALVGWKGRPEVALACVVAWALTRFWQKHVPGT
jgi:4-hydroxybenzoate polyprenyltransferase